MSGSVMPEDPDTGLWQEEAPQDAFPSQEPAALALHIICVMVPMGQ